MTKHVKSLAATIVGTTDDEGGPGGWTAIASAPVLDRDGEVIDADAFSPLPQSVPVHDGHNFDKVVGRARPSYRSVSVSSRTGPIMLR